MAISRTPKKQNEGFEPRSDNVFQALEAQTFGSEDDPNDNHPADDDKYAALEKRMQALQDQLEESQRSQMALLTNPQTFRSQTTEQVTFKPKDLPDQSIDPDGFARTVSENTRAEFEANQRQRQLDADRNNDIKEKVDGLWEDFSEAYPELSEDQDKVEFVAAKVVKRAKRKGIDPEKYMFVTQERFINDVAKEFEKTFGKVESEDLDEEDAPRSRRASARDVPARNTRRRSREEDDDGGDRTAGIFGGNESGGRPGRSKSNTDEGPSMIDDMQLLQRKTGFF